MAKTIATILGGLFILVGLAGFAAPHLLGAHLSATHNVIHLVTGAASLYLGLAGSLSAARIFCLAFGAVYLLLAVVGFLLGSGDDRLLRVIPNTLEFGTADHILHVLLGGIYLIGGLLTRDDSRVMAAT
ncbi:MAG TPA: DUF4383 domain-containing protein [Pyrinomonadaceae bacterium]|nr:DUF4383 domain-containing protein [Pyrinomonadaceae bacterium]